jgi:uncharacterized protein
MARDGSTTPPLDLRGPTSMSDKEFRSGIGVDFAVEARYAWDAGAAIGGYLDGLKKGVILGRVCHGCDRTLVPPRMFCEQCFRPTDAWTTVRDTGTVNTFSLAYITWDMHELIEPDIPAVIDLDGASPGIGIMHKLGDVDPKSVHTGMRVKAVWKPPEERTGSILDIAYWTAVGRGSKRSVQKASAKEKTKAKPRTAARKPSKTRTKKGGRG